MGTACSRKLANVRRMDLEEQTLEQAGDRCQVCGAKLTDQELAVILERGGPSLCSIHLADVVPVADEADDDGET
jgi:hypothetical protein